MIKNYSEFKIFESIQNYYEIDDQEFLYLKFSKSIDIEDRYINFLTKLKSGYNDFFTKLVITPAYKLNDQILNKKHITLEQTALNGYSVEHSIYQLEDDYFLIATFCSEAMSSFRNIKILGSESFYKCDQIEGLRAFLENFIEE